MNLGIENLKAVLIFGFTAFEAVKKVSEDDKYNLLDLPHLVPVLKAGISAGKGWKEVKGELLDIDDVEQVEIENLIDDFYEDIPSEEKKELIDDTVSNVIDIFQTTNKWIKYSKVESV